MFWVERYWNDTSHLTDAEHGIYLQLLILAWNSPDCRIPTDKLWIARKMRRSVEAIEKTVIPILLEFFYVDGQSYCQKKLKQEYDRALMLEARARAGGKARAEKLKLLKTNKNVVSLEPANVSGISRRLGSAPIPIPIPIPNNKNLLLNGHAFDDFWEGYPRKVGKGQARTAYERAIKKAPPETINAAAKIFAVECKDRDPKFIPHPSTWLNGERWGDKPPEKSKEQTFL